LNWRFTAPIDAAEFPPCRIVSWPPPKCVYQRRETNGLSAAQGVEGQRLRETRFVSPAVKRKRSSHTRRGEGTPARPEWRRAVAMPPPTRSLPARALHVRLNPVRRPGRPVSRLALTSPPRGDASAKRATGEAATTLPAATPGSPQAWPPLLCASPAKLPQLPRRILTISPRPFPILPRRG